MRGPERGAEERKEEKRGEEEKRKERRSKAMLEMTELTLFFLLYPHY